LRGDAPPVGDGGVPLTDLARLSLWLVLARKPLPHARAAAAAAIQFDVLLSTTKHVIPLPRLM
ncbi:MAG: hypothetical protein VXX66_09710, partial [Actinomycetota bacterium]|nr:hypothetical protein [Actinomycetota bacterium]